MWFSLVNKRVEGLVGAGQTLYHQGVRAHSQRQKHLGLVDTICGDTGHSRGAVHHGQTLFGLQP